MRFPRVTTFRNALLLAMLSAALIPAILVSLPLLIRIYAITRANAEHDLTIKASQISASIENEMILLANRGTALAEDANKNTLEPLLDRFLKKNTVVSSLHLLDPIAGNQILSRPPAMNSVPIPSSWKRWLQKADKEKGQLNHTSYQLLQLNDPAYLNAQAKALTHKKRSRPQSDWLIVLFLPISNSAGNLAGVLAAVVPLENIAQCHLYQVRPFGHLAFIQNGARLLDSSTQTAKETFVAKQTPLVLTHSGEGKNLEYGFEVSEPKALWFNMVRETIFHLGLALIIALILLTALAFSFSRALARPIRALTKQVIGYSSGQYHTARPRSEFKELDVFSQTLEQMAHKILAQIEHATLLERWRGEVERTQIQSALNNLREQMRPHFLFNTINNIAVMVEIDAPQSVRMLTKLADLYRLILESSKNTTSLLSLEMQIVENYLELQKMRFEDRLNYRLAMAGDFENVHAPSLLLQTLVENAIKHGIAKSRSGGKVDLVVRRNEKGYLVRIANSGAKLSTIPGNGTGLENTRQRLGLLYGPDHGFVIASDTAGDTVVQFTMSGERL